MKTQDELMSRLRLTLKTSLDLAESYDAKAAKASDDTWLEGYYAGKAQSFRIMAQWLESDGIEDE